MSRKVLIIQPDLQAGRTLSGIFSDWGDQVRLVQSLKEASESLQKMQPDLIIFEIDLLGQNWEKKIPVLRKRFPNIDLLFTSSKFPALPKQQQQAADQWGLIKSPFTHYGIQLALQNKVFEIQPDDTGSMGWNRLSFPIRFKITWPYLLLALLFTLAVSFITTRIVFDTVEERFTNQLIEAGKLSSEWMVIEENRILESIRLAANSSGVAESIQQKDSNELRNILYPVAVNSQEEALIVLDNQGISVISMYHTPDGPLESYEFTSEENIYAAEPIVQSVLQGNSDSIGDKQAAVISTPRGDFLFLAGGIYQNGAIQGLVLIGKTLDTLVQEMREVTLAQTTIYGFSGEVRATSLLESQPLTETDIKSILSQQDNRSYYQNIEVASINYTEILTPWEVRHGEDIGILGIAIPQNYLVSTSWLTRAQIFIALTGFILLIIVIGLSLARRITRPIVELAEASQQIAQGNLMISLSSEGSDEVAMLTASFNKMVESLRDSKAELIEAYDSSLEGWSRALTLRDHQTDQHSQRVVEMTLELAEQLNVPSEQFDDLRRGALLHDIGKVGIPDKILQKPDQLESWEWEIMQKHPIFAFEMLQPIDFLQNALEIPLYHHEKWDGTGYPYGLKGTEIPLAARIFSVVDVYDALMTDRPYRKAWTRNQAIRYIVENKGKHFDPEIVEVFLRLYGTIG